MADRLVVLREGRVQQIGTPEELHSQPVNWHVADFMGYRNLVDLEVAGVAGSEVTLTAGGVTVHGTAMEPVSIGEPVRVAIRPEDLVVVSESNPVRGGNELAGTVAVVEYHGREFAVTVHTERGTQLHVRSDHPPKIGSTVLMTADPARVLAYSSDLDAAPSSVEEAELDEVRS